MRLKFACLQINSLVNNVLRNSEIVHSMVNDLNDVDFVVLPELAFTGYDFPNRHSISHLLENPHDPSLPNRLYDMARHISRSKNCFTLFGYPEISGDKIYNSAALVSPNGTIIHNQRKTFLHDNDRRIGFSGDENRCFDSFDLILDKDYYSGKHDPAVPLTTIKASIGICMDINPETPNQSPDLYEMATSFYNKKTKLMFIPMNWIEIKGDDSKMTSSFKNLLSNYFSNGHPDNVNNLQSLYGYYPNNPSYSILNYWISRFAPFYNNRDHCHPDNNNVTIVFSNRVGTDSNGVYGGTSSIVQIFKSYACSPSFYVNYANVGERSRTSIVEADVNV